MKDFLNTQDWRIEKLEEMIDEGKKLKGKKTSNLDGKTLAMLFFNPSLRTRTSFEVGMYELGGHAVNLTVGGDTYQIETGEGAVMDGDKAEHAKEAAGVLSRYNSAIAVRSTPKMVDWQQEKKDEVVQAFAKHACVPVINMESNLYHPCQALADIMTIKDKVGEPKGKKIVVSWAYHPKALPTSVANSAALITSRFGMNVTIACPPGYELDECVASKVKANCEASGAQYEVVSEQEKAFEDADVVYAKSWGSLQYYGKPDEEKALRGKHKHWIVDEQKMDCTNHAKFMHCLPVRRNVVVTDEVIDGPDSIVLDQAENRLHAQKGLLKVLLGNGE